MGDLNNVDRRIEKISEDKCSEPVILTKQRFMKLHRCAIRASSLFLLNDNVEIFFAYVRAVVKACDVVLDVYTVSFLHF